MRTLDNKQVENTIKVVDTLQTVDLVAYALRSLATRYERVLYDPKATKKAILENVEKLETELSKYLKEEGK